MKAILSLREHQKRSVPEMHFQEGTIKAIEQIVKIYGSFDNIESFKALRGFAYKNYRKLGEAQPGSAFAQLFRAGVLTSTQGWYQRTEVNYEKYTMMDTTNMRQAFYGPLYGSQFPTQTPEGQPYTDNQVQGQDIEFIPLKFMGGESFTREMFDDDQTGQIKQRMMNLGQSARQREELEIAGRLNNVALTFGNATVALSTYTRLNAQGASVGPFSTTFYGTRGSELLGNRPASFVQLSLPAIKVALTALQRAIDPQGVPLAVNPDVLVVSPYDSLNARAFMQSTLYPGIQGQAGTTFNTAASGLAGGVASDNFLKGMLDVQTNIYMKPWSWNIGCKNKGLMFLRRDPLEVTQELPNSGVSFSSDVMRFRSRGRWTGNWNDAGFWYQGNDGSVSGVQ